MHPTFSTVIIAKNEEQNIAKCIEAICPICKEIIIVDSGSTDNTLLIATGLGAKVMQCNWQGYGNTKNWGSQQATSNWILSIDADEVPDNALLLSLQHSIVDNENVIYAIKRNTVFNNKKINFGVCLTEKKIRFFNKKNAKWDANDVHENLVFDESNTIVKTLKGCLLHYSYKNMADAKQRMDSYAQLYANQKIQEGKHTNLLLNYIKPAMDFLKKLFITLGFCRWQSRLANMLCASILCV